MTAALTPELALAYLRELSADLRAAVLLDAAGAHLAGPEPLAAPARALLDPDAPAEIEARTPAGAVFAARDDRHQLVAVTGPHALSRLTRHDLRTVLRALGGEAPREGSGGGPAAPSRAAVEALLAAAGGPR
jgi:hypothetical protein